MTEEFSFQTVGGLNLSWSRGQSSDTTSLFYQGLKGEFREENDDSLAHRSQFVTVITLLDKIAKLPSLLAGES